jgi:hypothetical protein
MAVRVRYKLEQAVSSTSAEERDLGNNKFEVVCDSQNEGGVWKTVVPAGAVDQPIPLQNVSVARYLALRTTAKDPTLSPVALNFRLNSITGEQIAVAPLPSTKEGLLVMSIASLTALYVSNPGAVDMDVIVGVVGD